MQINRSTDIQGPRDATNRAGRDTRERLIITAERLFAERGLDDVTIAEIARGADANGAAVHYHFGSKQNLIRAILEYRSSQLYEHRHDMLQALAERGDRTVRSVVEVLIESLANVYATAGPEGYALPGFLAALSAHPQFSRLRSEVLGPTSTELVEALCAAVPNLEVPRARIRLLFATQVVDQIVGQPHAAREVFASLGQPPGDAPVLAELVDFLVGGFTA